MVARTVPVAPFEQRRLLAPLSGCTAAVVLARFWIVWLAERAVPASQGLWWYAPLAPAQDLAVLAILWLTATAVHNRIGNPRTRRIVRVVLWVVVLVTLVYTAVNVELYRFVRSPLTYRLWALSDRLKGVRASLDAALDIERCVTLLIVPLVGVGVAIAVAVLLRRRPQLGRWLSTSPYVALLYGLAGSMLLMPLCPDRTAFANPYAALVGSLIVRDDPFIEGQVQAECLDEFDPARRRHPGLTRGTDRLDAFGPGKLVGHNVVLVVLESVGARYLSLYGAPWPTTPVLERLASRYGLVFTRAYAHAPWTSSAMASMFCSLLPRHGWRAIPGKYPRLTVPGLGDVLRRAGYRTALFHSGDLTFDDEDRFLKNHGFDLVEDYRTLARHCNDPGRRAEKGGKWQLPDQVLLAAARDWLRDARDQPWLLVLWTIQPHHPYVPLGPVPAYTGNADLNRYLAAITENDRLVGELWEMLHEEGLADRTLLVVTGDHGEAFGQHGHIAHGQTLFEEEVRVPLIFIHRAFRPDRLPHMTGQIDLAPTLVSLLGLSPAPEWQGQPLHGAPADRPVYLFTAYNHYLFGLVTRRTKYVLDATTGELVRYDLAADPWERQATVPGQTEADRIRRRLATWLHFQNPFLEGHRSTVR